MPHSISSVWYFSMKACLPQTKCIKNKAAIPECCKETDEYKVNSLQLGEGKQKDQTACFHSAGSQAAFRMMESFSNTLWWMPPEKPSARASRCAEAAGPRGQPGGGLKIHLMVMKVLGFKDHNRTNHMPHFWRKYEIRHKYRENAIRCSTHHLLDVKETHLCKHQLFKVSCSYAKKKNVAVWF